MKEKVYKRFTKRDDAPGGFMERGEKLPEARKKIAKKMKGADFDKWAKESKYDPAHKRDANSPAGIYQAKGSHFSKAGKSHEVKKGGWWKDN